MEKLGKAQKLKQSQMYRTIHFLIFNVVSITGAVIHNKECAPYQHEMIDNYLVDARQRFDLEVDLKAKQKQEQIEQHEKMKRDIYLNGGYVDCVNPGCVDQGTAETSYLCKSCFQEHRQKQNHQQSKSKFYIVPPPREEPVRQQKSPILSKIRNASPDMVDCGLIVPVFVNHHQYPEPVQEVQTKPVLKTVGHIVPVAAYTERPVSMRVKLPNHTSHPCKNTGCEFYGTPELDYFCSKCSKKAIQKQ